MFSNVYYVFPGYPHLMRFQLCKLKGSHHRHKILCCVTNGCTQVNLNLSRFWVNF